MKADEARRLRELERKDSRLEIALRGGPRRGAEELSEGNRDPVRRRIAVASLSQVAGSPRRACRVNGQHRSTQREPRRARLEAEAKLQPRLRQTARAHPDGAARRPW
jgi:hypothetical protein